MVTFEKLFDDTLQRAESEMDNGSSTTAGLFARCCVWLEPESALADRP